MAKNDDALSQALVEHDARVKEAYIQNLTHLLILVVFCLLEAHVDAGLACNVEAVLDFVKKHVVIDGEWDAHEDLLCIGGELSHRTVYVSDFFVAILANEEVLRESLYQLNFFLCN